MKDRPFSRFERDFKLDKLFPLARDACSDVNPTWPSDLKDLFIRFSGSSWNRGVYRVLFPSDVEDWVQRTKTTFPNFEKPFFPFAFDWLGRLFAASSSFEMGSHNAMVYMFSILTDEVIEIPGGVDVFHDFVLTEQSEPALEVALFNSFLSQSGIESVGYDKSAEMKVPLFLGGEFVTDNMRLEDTELYWEFMAQILLYTRTMEVGRAVDAVKARLVS